MAQAAVITGDVVILGNLGPSSFSAPASSIRNAAIAGSPSDYVDGSKIRARTRKMIADNFATTTATFRRVIHSVKGLTGTIVAFRCGNTTLNIGAATISVQLKKNGSNILSAATVLDTGNTAFVPEDAAGFTSTTLAANDCLEIDVTATAGGGTLGLGFFAELVLDEDPV